MQASPALAIFCGTKRGRAQFARGCEIAERQGETSGMRRYFTGVLRGVSSP